MAALTMTQQCLGMEDGFPKKGSTEDKLRFLIQYAILSPSVRNSQPWKFSVEKDSIHLSLDRSHAKRATDPDVRELIISCGAALKHLCIAARKFGYDVIVNRFPKGPGELLAIVQLDGQRPPTEMDTIMFYAIHKWLSVPKPLRDNKRVPHELLNELSTIGNTAPTWLHLARTSASRDTLAGLFAKGDVLQNKDEVVKEPPASKRRTEDRRNVLKMDVGKEAGHLMNYVMHFFQRDPGEDTVIRRKKEALVKSEPVMAVLGTVGNSPEAWLTAGERLAELLLRSMAVGIRATLISQPEDRPEIRDKLMKQLDIIGHPQVFLRLGFPDVHGDAHGESVLNEQIL
jgi:hypothetical protein